MLHECTYCGSGEPCDHVDEHPKSCCDCFEMFELGLGLAPWQAGDLPSRVKEKVRRAVERSVALADVLRAAEQNALLYRGEKRPTQET